MDFQGAQNRYLGWKLVVPTNLFEKLGETFIFPDDFDEFVTYVIYGCYAVNS